LRTAANILSIKLKDVMGDQRHRELLQYLRAEIFSTEPLLQQGERLNLAKVVERRRRPLRGRPRGDHHEFAIEDRVHRNRVAQRGQFRTEPRLLQALIIPLWSARALWASAF